jgi:hypothetical protein
MNIQRSLIFLLVISGAQVLASAQNTPSQDSSTALAEQNSGTVTTQSTTANSDAANNGTRSTPATALSGLAGFAADDGQDTNRDLPHIPALLGGRGMSMDFTTELERSNYLRGGVNVGAVYDDNPMLAPSGSVGNVSGSVFPNIKFEESTTRTRWELGYAGGLTVNQRFTSQNQGSHNLNFDSETRLTPHLNLRVAENFSMTTGFFDGGNGAAAITGAGGPNGSLITPLSTQRASLTTVETNYHFALNDLAGASGSFYDLNFSNVPAGVVLTNTQSESANAFWLHKFFPGNWGGISYRFDRITFDPDGDTRIHTFMLVDTLKLANGFSTSVFAGPQYADDQGIASGASQVSESKHWSGAGGAEAGWQNRKTSVHAGYSRLVSDGGGVLGAVRLQNVYGNFRRELLPGWAATLTASHGTNTSITVPYAGAPNSIHLTSAGAGLERNIGKSLGLRFSYTHDFQQQFGASGSTSLDAHRNRFAVTLSYQWVKPLGM